MAEHMKSLSGRHHPLVTTFRALARGRGGDGTSMLLDGFHLVADAVAAGVPMKVVAFTARALSTPDGARLAAAATSLDADVVEVSEPVMAAMSPVATPAGVVAIAARPDSSAERALERAPQLVVVALDVQEPGNVGAIVRAAEACGATGAIFCGSSADPFGWKALRGSMGSALRLPVAAEPSLDPILASIRSHGVRVVASLPRGGLRPDAVDLRQPTALLLGGEGPGLPDAALDAADERVSIPMRAPVESLNVAVAGALLVYEAARQRGTA